MSCNPKIKKYIQSLEALSQSMDDYLYIWDIKQDCNWFFGDIDKDFTIRENGHYENTTQEMFAITHPSDRENLIEDLLKIKNGEKSVHEMSYRWLDRTGRPVWINCRGRVINDEDGTPMALIGRVSRTPFDGKVNEITGMFNKHKMLEDAQTYQYMSRNGDVLVLGVDKLSKSYSEHGRKYIENILNTCARILESMSTRTINVYHAEEGIFAVCFEDVTRSDIRKFYNEFISRVDGRFTVTGVSLPAVRRFFTDERELYEIAYNELMKAKKNNRSKLSFYSKKDADEQLKERQLEEKLEQAVTNGFDGFYVCYQPQIRGGDYTIDGVEALMRFRADGQEYSPAQFIPLLEEMGLMYDAGLWVLKTALDQVKIWREKLPNLYLNVNFSLSQFANPDVIETVVKIYKESGLPERVLTLELTETVHTDHLERIAMATKTWKAAGIDVALDDFGTGYSNLAILKEIACSEIKIERTFVSHIKKGSYSYLLTSSIIDFAHQNDIEVCCEGVETEEDILTLSPLEPDLYQGYAFDRPCTVVEFERNYIHKYSIPFRLRKAFSKKLVKKDEDRITRFNTNEILTKVGIGLCVMMGDFDTDTYEMHPDETTEALFGMAPDLTPSEYYKLWFDGIKTGYGGYVKKNVMQLLEEKQSVRFMYPWFHPTKGEIILSFTAIREGFNKHGKLVIKVLHKIVTGIEAMGMESDRPLKYFVQNRYLDIILNKAIAFMEVNVTKNRVDGGLRDLLGNQPALGQDIPKIVDKSGYIDYDAFERNWADKYLIKADKDFYGICNHSYLKSAFENGENHIDITCKCKDKNGAEYDCRKSFFITQDEFNGSITALCVIYDISDEVLEKQETMHREATIRSLADDYKSIMYVNLDEDTVAFYREDKTIGDWYKNGDKHSVMHNMFAENFVSEKDKADYRYMLAPSTMREELAKADEYTFEYQRKVQGKGYRYSEVTVKRDHFNKDNFCATIAVKDIDDRVTLRIKLEEALEMAYTDNLTGLYNQQGLLVKCKEILNSSKVKSAVLFMDIDNFKSVNDVYGHAMGDKVLQEIAKAIREETRGKDVVGRYGGDEFVVLIYDVKNPEDAEEVAGRISDRIRNVCQDLKLTVKISVSIGISFTEQTGKDYHYLKEIADDRLYLAKKRGKDQIVKNI